MNGQQIQRERWQRAGEGTKQFNAATRLTESTEIGREEKWAEILMQHRQTGLQETAGAIRRPAGAGQHSAVFNQDQKATL